QCLVEPPRRALRGVKGRPLAHGFLGPPLGETYPAEQGTGMSGRSTICRLSRSLQRLARRVEIPFEPEGPAVQGRTVGGPGGVGGGAAGGFVRLRVFRS